MIGVIVPLVYAASVAGTVAYCLFWVEFSVPALNVAWLIAVPVAGTAVEILLARKGPPAVDPRFRIAHFWTCGLVAIYSVAWPGALMLLTRNFPPRPDFAFLACLAPLAPYLLAGPAAMDEWWDRSFSRWCLEGMAAVILFISSTAMVAINALAVLLLTDPPEACEASISPDGDWVVRTECRRLMLSSVGNVWLESTRFPIRRLVHGYNYDHPTPTIRWDAWSRLIITGRGRTLGRPLLF